MPNHTQLQFDYNYALAENVGKKSGLSLSELEKHFSALRQIQRALADLKKLGQLPFQELLYLEETVRTVQMHAGEIRNRFEDIVVLGIGGSGLGPRCLYEALCFFQPIGEKQGRPRLTVIDNVDGALWKQLLERIQIEKTFFIVISKSGQTVETLAAFIFFRDQLIHHLGPAYTRNLSIITDPHQGPLRQLATTEQILSFPIPPALGGRYSVLSPVGLFPAACVGLDIQALLAGARRMDQRGQCEDFWLNAPYLSGLIHYLLATKKHKGIRILMPYAERLGRYSEWFCQLWAESLGKRFNLKGKKISAGQTPVRTMGATDQHSQLQLYLEGPQDKVISFYRVSETGDLFLPERVPNDALCQALAGKPLSELLEKEYQATEYTLMKAGVPSTTLTLPRLTEDTLGQLFYFAELETVVAGELYNINPFDQPAVEAIKNTLRGLLGLPRGESYAQVLIQSPKEKRFII